MRPRIRHSAALLVLLTIRPMSAGPPDGSDWVGLVSVAGRSLVIQFHLGSGDSPTTGRLDVISKDVMGLPASVTADSNGEMRVECRESPWGLVRLSGQRSGEVIEGHLESALGVGTFHLLLVARLDPAAYDRCAGWYRTEEGAEWLVTWDPYGGLKYMDFANREEGYWLPKADWIFNAWDGRVPIERTIEFQLQDGRVTGFEQRSSQGRTLRARRMSEGRFHQRQVGFSNGAIPLAGLLLTPVGSGPHPAVVFIAGSGHQTRERGRELYIAARLLHSGIATLLYDKRGTGASGGHWREASIEDLARDALAAMDYLRKLDEINAQRVGLYGVSQGGVVAAQAAALSQEAAFLINDSGSLVDFTASELFAIERRLRRSGVPDAQMAEALGFARIQLAATADEASWKRYKEKLETVRGSPWLAALQPTPEGRNDPDVRFWSRIALHDPMNSWAKIACPALILYGENDQNVPVPACLARVTSLTEENGRDITVKVFPGGGHTLMDPGGADPFVDGFLELLVNWARKQAFPSRD